MQTLNLTPAAVRVLFTLLAVRAHQPILDSCMQAAEDEWEAILDLYHQVKLLRYPKEFHMHPVVSSNVTAVGYQPVTQMLRIAYKNGTLYDYAEVPPAAYEGILGAGSVGKYINEHIKKGGYAYIKVEASPGFVSVEPQRLTGEPPTTAIPKLAVDTPDAIDKACRFKGASPGAGSASPAEH